MAAGTPLKSIGITQSDPYDTAFIANAGCPLAGAASLEGKRIATACGSIGHYKALAALESARLK